MTTAASALSGALDVARWWTAHGYYVIPVPPQQKAPILQEWEQFRLGLDDLPAHFANPKMNVGALLGEPNGNCDADLDCTETLSTWPMFALYTGLIFGRPSKPRSHYFYRCNPPRPTIKFIDPLSKKTLCELRCLKKDGTVGLQTIVPASTHKETGEPIRFDQHGEPATVDAEQLARAVALTASSALLARYWPAAGQGRHETMMALAGVLARARWTQADAAKFCRAVYGAIQDPDPTAMRRSDSEVQSTFENFALVKEITGWPTLAEHIDQKVLAKIRAWLGIGAGPVFDDPHVEARTRERADKVPTITLTDVITIFTRWLVMPDNASALKVTLAAVAANLIPGDPLWLLLVGATGSGKTELLDPLLNLPNTYSVGTLTEAALLSGSSRRDRGKDASGGLLHQIGTFGFLILKDFTTVLSMGKEMRAPLLAALREIYDGHWTRHIGQDGGRVLCWQGKVPLVGGCTPAIDQHHGLMAMMGERFLMFRMPAMKPEEQAIRAMQHVGREQEMRSELKTAVTSFMGTIPREAGPFDEAAHRRMAAIATFVARARSAVERNPYDREIELIPESEMPGRLARSLRCLFHGAQNIGMANDDAWKLIAKVAVDCIPDIRSKVLRHLKTTIETGCPIDTSAIAEALAYPTTTVRRALEELTGHELVKRFGKGSGTAHKWEISNLANGLLDRAQLDLEPFPKKEKG
jgi:hypothetical protein